MEIWSIIILTLIIIVILAILVVESFGRQVEVNERIKNSETQRECLISIETSLRKISVNFDNAMKEINDIND